MIKGLKKPIVYLLATMLVLPVYLLSGIIKAPTAYAAELLTVTVNSQVTNDSKPDIRGALSARPDSMKVSVDGKTYKSSAGDVDISSHAPWTWHIHGNDLVSDLAEGTYDVSAVATKNDAETSDSTIGELVVDFTSPTVANVTAENADGSYSQGTTINLIVKFSEKVEIIGAPYVNLELGSIRKANYLSGSGTDAIIFSYSIESGDTSLDLDYEDSHSLHLGFWGSIKDLAGNSADRTLAVPGEIHSLGYNKNIIVDTTAPEVNVLTPAKDDTVSGGTKYVITWEAKDLESEIKDNSVLIEYEKASDDWEEIVNSAPNTGLFEWLVPIEDPLRDDAKIRVTVTNNAGLSAEQESEEFTIFDYTKPEIKLNGDNPMTIVKGSTFTDPGAVVSDNYSASYLMKGTGIVDSNTVGTYSLVYSAEDNAKLAADSITRIVKVVEVNPIFTITHTDGKNFVVKFNGVGNGVTGYVITINGVGKNIAAYNSGDDLGYEYSYSGSVLEYGKSYPVHLTANGVWGSVTSAEQSFSITAPVVANTTAITTAVATSTRIVGTASAAAPEESTGSTVAPPSDNNTSGTGDENGKIKGEEEPTQTEEEDKVNWTPWIILFILIILAGAATGGYFYWFAGEEEVEKEAKKPVAAPVEDKKKEEDAPKTNSSKSGKKSRRW